MGGGTQSWERRHPTGKLRGRRPTPCGETNTSLDATNNLGSQQQFRGEHQVGEGAGWAMTFGTFFLAPSLFGS